MYVIFDKYGFEYMLKWLVSGLLFFMLCGELLGVLEYVICIEIGIMIELLMMGGMLDGCFIVCICL